MPKVKLEIESDYGPVVNTFNSIQNEIRQTKGDVDNLNKASKKAFGDAAKSASNFGDKVKKSGEEMKSNVQKFNETSGVIGKLVEKERQLREARDKSNSPNLIKKYNALIDETKKKLNELTSVQKQAEKTNPFKGMIDVLSGNVLFSLLGKAKQAITQIFTSNIALDKSLKNLSAITGASGKDLEFYGIEAQKMGIRVQGGAVAVVEAFKLIGSAKPELLKNKEALVDLTKAAITLSEASGLTLPEAASNLGNALNAFGADASQANKFINVLAASAQLGAKEIPFITEALSKFGGVAKQANVSIEESAAAIEILGAKIPEASIVGTNLRGVLIKLQVIAGQAGRQFKGLGEELELLAPKVKDVTFLKEKFGDENLLAIQTLIAEREELNKMTEAVEGTNSALEQAATNTDTMAQKSLEAGNAYDAFLTALGKTDLVADATKKSLDILISTFTSLTQLANGTFFDADNVAMRNIKDFNRLFVEGKIDAQTYIDYLKANFGNLSKENLKTFLSNQGGASGGSTGTGGETTETIGIIDQLQKDIEALTTRRLNSVAISEIFGLNDQIEAKQKELEKLLGKSAKNLLKIQEDYDRALADLRKKSDQAKISQLSGEERILAERDLAVKEIGIEEDKFFKIGQLLDKNFKLTEEQKEIFRTLALAAERKAADDILKLEQEKLSKIRALNLTQLGANEETAINSINGSPNKTRLSAAQFEDVKQRQIIDIQQKYNKLRLELKLKNLEAELQADLLDKTQDEKFLRDKYAVERQIIINEADKITNALNKQKDELNKKPFSLLTNEQISAFQGLASEFQTISNTIFDEKNRLADLELQKNQELLDSRNHNIEDLRDKLTEEHALKEAGHANNVDAIERQLAQEERLRKEALVNEKKIKAERAKLAKEQLNLDTIVQASNMAVAVSKVFETYAAVPYVAAALAAAMVGAFAFTKVKAYEAANRQIEEANQYAEGVVGLNGPGTETSDSIPARLSKGESVITAKKTKQNRRLLEGIHEDDPNKIHLGILDLIRNQGISLQDDLPEVLSVKKEMVRQNEINAYLKTDNSRLEKRLDDMTEILSAMLKDGKNKEFLDHRGNLVIRKGSHTTILTKK